MPTQLLQRAPWVKIILQYTIEIQFAKYVFICVLLG